MARMDRAELIERLKAILAQLRELSVDDVELLVREMHDTQIHETEDPPPVNGLRPEEARLCARWVTSLAAIDNPGDLH